MRVHTGMLHTGMSVLGIVVLVQLGIDVVCTLIATYVGVHNYRLHTSRPQESGGNRWCRLLYPSVAAAE